MVSWETAQRVSDPLDPTKTAMSFSSRRHFYFLLKDLGRMSTISQEPPGHYLHESPRIEPKILPEDYKSWKKLQKVPDVKYLGVFALSHSSPRSFKVKYI